MRNDARLIEGQQIGTWTVATCLRATETCFALAGGSAVYRTSPLQRRLRDLQVLSQHAIVQQRQYVAAGKLLLGDLAEAKAGRDVEQEPAVRRLRA